MSGILTTDAATYAAQTLRGTTKVDIVARADAEVADWCTADWANDVDADLVSVNAWLVGTSSAGISGNTTTLLGALTVNEQLTLGDDSTDAVAELRKAAASSSYLNFKAGGASATANDKRLKHHTDETLLFQHYSGTWDTVFSITNTPDVDIATDLALNSASPVLKVGNFAGSPIIKFQKDATGSAQIQFFSESTPDAGSWRFHHESDEEFSLDRWGGATWDNAIRFDANRDMSVATDLTISGALNHDGSTVGFYGTTPAAQSAAYTRNATVVEDRTLLASASATATNNNNVLAALIADLQNIGLLG